MTKSVVDKKEMSLNKKNNINNIKMENKKNECLEKLKELLNNNRIVNHDEPFTHLSYGNILGKFNIPDDKINEFMKCYIKCIKYGCDNLSLLEKQKQYSPLLIDIDLKACTKNDNDKLYDYELIETIINYYKEAIEEYLIIPDKSKIKIGVFEKENVKEIDDYYKDGIHIVFPDIITNIETRHLIRLKVVEKCIENKIFDDYIEKTEKILDKAVVSSNCWFLYGSRKPEDKEAYKLTYFYNYTDNDYLNNYVQELDESKIIQLFSMNLNYNKYNINNALEIIKHDIVDNNINNNTTITNNNNNTNNNNIIPEETLIKIMNTVNPDDFEAWRDLGFVFINENLPLNIYNDYEKRSKKYNEKKNKEMFKSIKPVENGLTINTLFYYLKRDNPELFYELQVNKKINGKTIFDNEKLKTRSIAKHFKQLYGNKFIYQNDKLYCYNGVYWKPDNKKYTILNNFVCDIYFPDLLNEFNIYEKQILKINTSEDIINYLKNTKDYIYNILNFKKREEIIKDMMCILSNDLIKFDNEPYLFAFENKIFDLRLGEFIEPKPEYYISISCGYDYIQDNINNKDELNKLLDSIFPQPELKKLYLTILSTGLDGLSLEKFILANAPGGNGKGVINELTQHMLGNYAYVLPSNVLLKELKTGSNPEVANMLNKRFVIAREPDKNLQFNCATIKEITGGAEINARLNHSNDTKILLNNTFILECNEKPKLNEVNDAMSRRIIDIPFKNRFVDKHIYDTLDEEEKKTTFLINKFYKTIEFKEQFKITLFLMLSEYYKEYYSNNKELPITDEIMERNNNYLCGSDELFMWFNDKFEKTDNVKDIIKLKDVYELYQNSEYYNNLTKLQKRQNNYKHFNEKLENNIFLKKYVKENIFKVKIITNYRIKKHDDNIIDGLDD